MKCDCDATDEKNEIWKHGEVEGFDEDEMKSNRQALTTKTNQRTNDPGRRSGIIVFEYYWLDESDGRIA